MSIQKKLFVMLLILLPVILFSQTINFNVDSTYSYVKHFSVTIGAHPRGYQNENIVLNWVKEKFDNFGADSAYIIKFFESNSQIM